MTLESLLNSFLFLRTPLRHKFVKPPCFVLWVFLCEWIATGSLSGTSVSVTIFNSSSSTSSIFWKWALWKVSWSKHQLLDDAERTGNYLSFFLGIILPFFLQAVKLTSSRTQLPYEYYSLPFCQPSKITYKAENLGVYLSDSVGGVYRGKSNCKCPFCWAERSCILWFTACWLSANSSVCVLDRGGACPDGECVTCFISRAWYFQQSTES